MFSNESYIMLLTCPCPNLSVTKQQQQHKITIQLYTSYLAQLPLKLIRLLTCFLVLRRKSVDQSSDKDLLKGTDSWLMDVNAQILFYHSLFFAFI